MPYIPSGPKRNPDGTISMNWDGKSVIVIGTVNGGGQAVVKELPADIVQFTLGVINMDTGETADSSAYVFLDTDNTNQTSVTPPVPAPNKPTPTTISELVKHGYSCILGRSPSQGESDYWVSSITNHNTNTPQKFYDAFFGSPEYTSKPLSNGQHLNLLYQCVLFRNGDDEEFAYHMATLNKGEPRLNVLHSFLNDTEFQTRADLVNLKKLIVNGGSVLGASTFNFKTNMEAGSSLSPDVTELQKLLHKLFLLDSDSITGYFGKLTTEAVKTYQSIRNIQASGAVYEKTREALNKE